MPKVLLYTTAKIVWTFLFFGRDVNENRAHVHIGKKDTEHFAKFWLEPAVELAKEGDLTDAQLKKTGGADSRRTQRVIAQAMANFQEWWKCEIYKNQ